jgi:large subunit ribosomal protein L10
MVRPEKLAAVADIAEEFRRSTAALVTEYRGLSMTQLTTLRRALGPQATYRVAKNTLIARAARDAGVQGMDELFIGPTAIAFVHDEPVTVARALRDFAREHPALVIKGGYLEGRPLSGTEVTQIADLDSREVLLAKLAGAMKGSLAKAARLFAEPAARVARLASALRDKRQEQPG